MSKSVHGHEVMQMMVESGRSYSKVSLAEEIGRRFGADTRFHTCSAEDMTAEELVDFLESRGKFQAAKDGFQTSADKICNH